MPSFLLTTYRKPGLTMAAFVEHYENVHVPLLREIAGAAFPARHVRHYVERDPDGPAGTGDDRNANSPTTLVQGDITRMDWDCLTEIEFRDDAHLHAFLAATGHGDGLARRVADEQRFVDADRITLVKQAQVRTSTNPGP